MSFLILFLFTLQGAQAQDSVDSSRAEICGKALAGVLANSGKASSDLDNNFLSFYEEKLIHAYQDKFPGQFNVKERVKQILEGENPYGLTEAEVTAIVGYTGVDHALINGALRAEIRSDFNLSLEDAKFYSAMLNQALSKLPNYVGTVYRYVDFRPEAMTLHQEGAVVTYSGFSSSSALAEPEARKIVGPGFNNELEIQSVTGKLIEKYSYTPNEREVLFPPGQFKIIKRIQESRRIINFKMVQI